MPFAPGPMTPELVSKLVDFAKTYDFADLYKRYRWGNDDHKSSFQDILKLELRLSASDKSNGISLEDVLAVAKWGAPRNLKIIRGSDTVLEANKLHTNKGESRPELDTAPLGPVKEIVKSVPKGLGPARISKVLRFGLAEEYGVIDSQLVRVFGIGDSKSAKHEWLKLKVRNYGDGWHIPRTQSGWPAEYGTWINILRFFCYLLPAKCPHPAKFVDTGQRRLGKWTCADVEMALFCYANQFT